MPATRLIVTGPNGSIFYDLDVDDQLLVSIYRDDDCDIALVGVINGESGVEVGCWDRSGEYIQRWHERSDT